MIIFLRDICSGKRVLTLLLLLVSFYAGAIDRIAYMGKTPFKGDTTRSFSMMVDFKWDVYEILPGGIVEVKKNARPDIFGERLLEGVVLHTRFLVDTVMVNKVFSMAFSFSGSTKITLNNEVLLKTGVFLDKTSIDAANEKWMVRRQDDFSSFMFRDTMARFTIEYVPYVLKKRFSCNISMGQQAWAHDRQDEIEQEKTEAYSLGFFYLSFAIIFCLLFLFSRVSRENLYFALFCLFVALSFLLENATYSSYLLNFSNYAVGIAIELLAIFFSLVFVKKEKSKISLIVIFLLSCIFSLPALHYQLNFGVNFSFSVVLLLSIIIYASLYALYYLVQGFGQKKWEATTIAVGSLTGFFLGAIVPVILAVILSQKSNDVNVMLYWCFKYLPELGICIYPLTVAIVLGKRNALNQIQLTNQVMAIEKLSKEKIENEKEKKKILEEQNTYLETKVSERTQELALKNELITEKNKEITDSLHYARRIQGAILPDLKRITAALPQSFVLYLPKDIGSGDFYAFAHKEDSVIIASADCTGHGVAGAFMSMIGSSLLNQIINEKNIINPALILDELNDGVIHSLKQRESDSNDGMDIAICRIQKDRSKLFFSGANRPLWIIRNGTVLAYRPDKFPIGGLQIIHDERYHLHQIDLVPGDCVYLFSDGYADQFGGNNGKKLMSKKFREVLLSIQHIPMAEQKPYLTDYFDKWKGSHEQVDDVLVIGFKV